MNTLMKSLTMIVVTATLSGFASPAASADGNAAFEERKSQSVRFNIEFDGGTLKEFVQLLRQKDPTFNIIIQEHAASFPLPRMELKGVSIKSCIWMIDREHVDRNGQRLVIWSEQYPSVNQDLIVIGAQSVAGQNRATRAGTARLQLENEFQTRIFFIGNLLSHGYSSDMILEHVAQLQELQGVTGNQSQAIIDDQSDVLMVRARNRHLMVIEELLEAMDQGGRHRKAVMPTASKIKEDRPVPDRVRSLVRMLTQEEISSMTDGQLREQISEVAAARKYARLDQELSDQLANQFQMVMDELKRRR